MSWLSSIFATPDTVKTAAKGIYNGLDKLVLTSEEEAEFWLKYLEATQPQNLARRLIALTVCAAWCLFLLVTMFAIFFAGGETLDYLVNFGTVYIMPPFTLITSWYFWKRIKDA